MFVYMTIYVANEDQMFEVFDQRRVLELVSVAYDKQQIELELLKQKTGLFKKQNKNVAMKSILKEFENLVNEENKKIDFTETLKLIK